MYFYEACKSNMEMFDVNVSVLCFALLDVGHEFQVVYLQYLSLHNIHKYSNVRRQCLGFPVVLLKTKFYI